MANRFSVTRLADASAAIGTAKTMLRLLAGANDPVTIIGWWIEFDSVSSSDKPIKVELLSEITVSAPTGTAATPLALEPSAAMGTPSAAALVACTAEGTPTYAATAFENHMIPATGGFYLQYPLGREIKVAGGLAVRMRVTAVTTAVNITYGMMYEE